MSSSFGYGQEEVDSSYIDLNLAEDTSDLDIFIDCFPIQAEFIGGLDSLNTYLLRTIHYPDSAKVLKISGVVYISFVVEIDGRIGRVKLIKGIGGGCDEVAIEAIRNMPRWESEMWNGKPQPVVMNIPIRFSLDKTDDNDSLQ